MTLDLARGGQAIRSGMLPGQANVADKLPCQPQLPAGGGDQAGPAVGGGWVARADGRPAKRLLEKAEGVFDREAPQVPAPQDAQGGRQWTADPGQPEGPWWQLLVGEAFNPDPHHAERGIRRAWHMEIGPGIDLDFTVGSVVQTLRIPWLAMGVRVGQPKRLAMQAWPSAAGPLLGGAIHHTVFGQ